MKKIYFIIVLIFILSAKNIFAYIDPGTGSIILNSFSSAIGLAIAFISGLVLTYFIKPIKNFIFRIKNKTKDVKNDKKE